MKLIESFREVSGLLFWGGGLLVAAVFLRRVLTGIHPNLTASEENQSGD